MEEFENLEWHDALLKNIIIDRSDPGVLDNIEIIIKWTNGDSSKLIFREVYMANLDLNFGVIADECISHVNLIKKDDPMFSKLIKKWVNLYEGVLDLKGFEIKTITTNSTIRIFSKNIKIVTYNQK